MAPVCKPVLCLIADYNIVAFQPNMHPQILSRKLVALSLHKVVVHHQVLEEQLAAHLLVLAVVGASFLEMEEDTFLEMEEEDKEAFSKGLDRK